MHDTPSRDRIALRSRMDFDETVNILNELLAEEDPAAFSSSWVLRRAPACYRFIQENVRTNTGRIDWDRVHLTVRKEPWEYKCHVCVTV